jgi:hypothetical protein
VRFPVACDLQLELAWRQYPDAGEGIAVMAGESGGEIVTTLLRRTMKTNGPKSGESEFSTDVELAHNGFRLPAVNALDHTSSPRRRDAANLETLVAGSVCCTAAVGLRRSTPVDSG